MSTLPAGIGTDLSAAPSTAVKLRAAAVFLFAARGYAGTSIRDIAALTGVTNAAVYHFVKNKEDLLLDIMREGQSLLHRVTLEMLDQAPAPEDRLAVLVTALAGAHGKNRRISFVTDHEIRSLTRGSAGFDEIVRMRDDYERLWDEVIAEGVATGTFQVTNQRTAKLAILNMCTGVSSWYRPDGPNPLEDILDEFVTYALRVVGATRNGSPLTAADVQRTTIAAMPMAPWEPTVLVMEDHNEQS